MSATINSALPSLAAPERNLFFYGLLMDAQRFDRETHYQNQKRWLLNRLVLGAGVVSGLDVISDGVAGKVRIQSGVALDGWGREILVPEASSVDAQQLTDDEGAPSGDPISTGTVTLFLSYVERCTDLVPVLVPECNKQGSCAPSTIREGFRLLVRMAEGNPAAPPGCGLSGGFPLPPNGSLHGLLADRTAAPFPSPPADPSVALARISLDTGAIDSHAGRPLVYGNGLLHELVLCLSEKVAQISQGRILRYVSGDGQTGKKGQALTGPLVVELVDVGGNPVTDELVQFTPSDGSVGPGVKTGLDGRASAAWTLGNAKDEEVKATALGSAFTVRFVATAK